MPSRRSSRREVIKAAAGLTAGAISFPCFVPARSLGADGNTAPSNRLVMGCIGVGGQGTGNMNAFMRQGDVQVVAVCDVERESDRYHGGGARGREPARRQVDKHYAEKGGQGGGCKAYEDYRELLARKDIDAVTVCTPDHWHALASIAAADAGKHVYCEKPLANSVAEGRAICGAVNRNRIVLQNGSHERSNANGRLGCELVRNGRIGKLQRVLITLPTDQGHHQAVKAFKDMPAAQPAPETLNYELWQGHTPKVPYMEKRVHFWWRFVLAYGGGEMTDRGAHVIDLAQLGMGMDDTGPVHLAATGTRTERGLYDAFMEFEFKCRYANGVEMIGSSKPGPRGVRFEGDKGWIFINVHGCKLEASDPELLKPIEKPGVDLGRSPGHHRNFLDSVFKGAPLMATAEIGHRTASICHLLNISMLLGKPLEWDPKAEQVTNLKEANELLCPPGLKGKLRA